MCLPVYNLAQTGGPGSLGPSRSAYESVIIYIYIYIKDVFTVQIVKF